MATKNHHTRRTFIGFGLAASAGIATRSRAQSPNEKLNIAIIGAGGRGGANTGGVRSEAIYALCDTNPSTLSAAKKRFPAAKTTSDWREVVDDPAIDAVVVSTADHHHAPASIAAMRAGKHVYSEKPLAHTVQEARWMQDEYIKRKDKIATQMGTQIHATENYRRTVELIRAGAVGTIKQAHVWCGRTINTVGEKVLPAQEIPAGFNWETWLGPAPDREHNTGYWKGGNLNWNRRWDFGNGVLGDMGSHLIDLPYWALDLKRPATVKAEGTDADNVAAPPSQIITWRHENAAVGGNDRGDIDLIWYHGPQGMKEMAARLQPKLGGDTNIAKWHIGVAFVGTEGTVVSDYGKIVLSPGTKFKEFKRPEASIPKSAGHHKEWIKACKGEGKTLCNFDYSGALIENNLLGNLAHRAALGKELQWDAEKFKINNHEEANSLLSKTYRKGWEIA
jgi:predicted dehydrogenase